MRKLFIMRGAMGCGKSTFIEKHDLKRFTLSADTIRLMLNAPELTLECTEQIPQYNNKKAWKILYEILEERMKKGEFTIVDAVHARADESFPIYKRLAEKYRYRLYVLNFTDVPKEEVYARNENREDYKIVPTFAIDRAYKTFAKDKIPSSFEIVKPENFENMIASHPRSFDDYEAIHLIGDVHACHTALKSHFDNHPIKEDELYIFLGDYFDRGLENVEVFRFLNDIAGRKNVILLVGNHEDRLYKYACDDEVRMDYDLENTIRELEEANVKKSEIRGFIKGLSQIAYFTFAGKTYLANHGGIPCFPKRSLDFYSTNSFIYGIDKYDVDIDKIYDEAMQKSEEAVYQIHGHRNYYNYAYDAFEYSLNLEGDIENGGYLRVLTLNKDGSHTYDETKNDLFDIDLKEKTNVYNLLELMRTDRNIYEKDLGDGISSFNFTKEAFYNRAWNDMTIKARGLFIDTANKRILARSYDKFFKMGERPETQEKNLEKTLSFPVNFYLKYNGFLGILSSKNGELFFASKSTTTGNYVELFKNIFQSVLTRTQIETLKEKIVTENWTAVFEVIDPLNDPHIIEYSSPQIVLLDLIRNETAYRKLPYEELKKFAAKNDLPVKKLAYTAEDMESFENIFATISVEDYKMDDEFIEGFVAEDASGFMFKIKTHYYDYWKRMRSKMEKALETGRFESKSCDEKEIRFMDFLKNKYDGQKTLISTDIIAERKELEEKDDIYHS